jgi:hypothetical protein
MFRPDIIQAGESFEYLNLTVHINWTLRKRNLLRVIVLSILHYGTFIATKIGILKQTSQEMLRTRGKTACSMHDEFSYCLSGRHGCSCNNMHASPFSFLVSACELLSYNIFSPMPSHVPYGLRGLPSRPKCNRLPRLGCA